VVTAVLAEVAFLAGRLDALGDLGTALAGQVLELRLEAVERLLSQEALGRCVLLGSAG